MNVKVIDVHIYDYVLVVVVEYVIKSLVPRKKLVYNYKLLIGIELMRSMLVFN